MSQYFRNSFRFLQVSTDEVYGNRSSIGEARETSAYMPSSPYAASKESADHHVRSWARTYGIPALITHGCNIYGSGQHEEKLIPKVIANALNREKIPVFGSGKQVRDWIHVDDNAKAIITILDKGIPGESYNISAGNELANLDLIHLICRTLKEYLNVEVDAESI